TRLDRGYLPHLGRRLLPTAKFRCAAAVRRPQTEPSGDKCGGWGRFLAGHDLDLPLPLRLLAAQVSHDRGLDEVLHEMRERIDAFASLRGSAWQSKRGRPPSRLRDLWGPSCRSSRTPGTGAA